MDILYEILQSINFSGMLFSQPRLKHPWAIKEDSINGFLFHYAVKGDLHFKLSGQKKWEYLKPGDFVLILSGQGNTIASTPNARETHINDVLPKLAKDSKYSVGGTGPESQVLCGCFVGESNLLKLFQNPSYPYFVIRESTIKTLGLSLYLDDLIAHHSRTGNGAQIMIDSLLKIVFLKVFQNLIAEEKISGPIPGVHKSPIVLKVTEVFESDLSKKWSVEELVATVGCSRNTLITHCKTSIGMGPIEYSNFLRILKAQLILVSRPDIRVKNLAEMLGYQSDENFLFNFKKFTQMTPREFKDQRAKA